MVDDGCISGSALAVNRSYLATGSSEGVVNIYSLANTNQAHPKPDKVRYRYILVHPLVLRSRISSAESEFFVRVLKF